jgi:aminoglycoside phosphotransferase (APT) family kinase protein
LRSLVNADDAVAAWRLLATSALLALARRLPAGAGAIPFDLSGLSTDWLTRVLDPVAPGLRVRRFERLDQHSGTTTRARIAIEYADPGRGEKLPDTVFVKIAPSAFAQRLFTAVTHLGRNEVAFYRTVRPDLPVRAPRAWAAESSGDGRRFAMLLEDLAAQQVRFAVVGDRTDLEMTRRMMGELARLHAAFWESPRFAGDLAWVPCRENRRHRDRAVERFITRRMLGIALGRFAAELPPAFARAAHFCMERRDDIEALWAQGPRALVHGDCHLGNLFFEGDRVGFLDWQVVTRAPGMRDVSYFLCNSCPDELRRTHERALIALYLERLAGAGVPAPTFNVAWKQHRLFAVYTWLAATFTAAAGGGLQPRDIGLAALRRTTRAIVELDSVGLLEHELGA